MTKRTLPSTLQLVAACAGLVASAGCYETDGQIYIRHTTPITQAQPPDCSINDGDTVQLGGLLDIGGVGSSYTNIISVATNLPANITSTTLTQSTQRSPSTPNYGTGENNAVFFDSYEVFLTDANGEALNGVPGPTNPRVTEVGGGIQNVQTQLAQNTLLSILSITPQEAAALLQENVELTAGLNGGNGRETVVINIKINAQSSGGGFLRSQVYSFPLQICDGCLIAIGGAGQGQCLGGVEPLPAPTANSCVPQGQDVAVSVCP